MFSSYNTRFVVFTILVLLNLENAVGDDGCSFTKTPGRNIFVTAGENIELEWNLAGNLTKYSDSIFRISQPDTRVLYAIVIKTNKDFPETSVLKKNPFSKRIKWTGNTTQNKLSFIFSNVTRDLSLKYYVEVTNCGPSLSGIVELHVSELPTKPSISCSNKIMSNKIILKIESNLNCSCLATEGSPSRADTYWETPAFKNNNNSVLAIDHIQEIDGGNYTCVASNTAGNETNRLEVEVHYLYLQCFVKFEDKTPIFHVLKLKSNPVATCNRPCYTPFPLSTKRTAVYNVTASNGDDPVVCNVSAVYNAFNRTCGGELLFYNLTYYSFKSNGTYRAIALLQHHEQMFTENNFSVDKNGKLLMKSVDRLLENKPFAKRCKIDDIIMVTSSSVDVGTIVGSVVGGLAVLAFIFGLAFWRYKIMKKRGGIRVLGK